MCDVFTFKDILWISWYLDDNDETIVSSGLNMLKDKSSPKSTRYVLKGKISPDQFRQLYLFI
jgi:hypothetical protein